ncbi:formyl-CoA transferase [Alcanivorax balearicus MACL04]|uniref:Formyl-CoA transferase n=1 Tax=Alloalcanivorax balearicus MACL04 TaxID=1177182 RepID=A0ABT2QYV9_9GAMM|nr:CoA transferase [Alloalcanivorax balearicus]MCU5782707.1 formyl-CoA transferase [Alloalcanivorax balearicus MACL04]
MKGALNGIRVLDLSRFVAGPYCAMMLADMGAEVIKIERPGPGEVARGIEPGVDGQSYYSFVVNRNKLGLTLDYRQPDGRDLLRELVAEADVLVENFRPGVMEAMGCGWDVLSAINPRLVMARISGFGQSGPLANKQCFDAVAQAMSGLMDMTGDPAGPPMLTGTTVIDYTTGMYAAMGVLAAINARHQTGQGQVVDVALLDSAVSLLLSAIPERAHSDTAITRRGNRDRFCAPSNTFQTRDRRWVLINCADDPMFERLAVAMGWPDLVSDPRFESRPRRVENRDRIEAMTGQWVAGLTAREVEAILEQANVPCAVVATIDDVLENEQLRHRGQITEVAHQSGEKVVTQGVTMQLSDTPLSIRSALPYVGEHSSQVLSSWLGYSEQRIGALAEQGIISVTRSEKHYAS